MDPLIVISLRAFLALIFAAAILHKVQDWRRFVGVVRNFEIARPGFAAFFAGAALIAEMSALGLLLAGPVHFAGMFAAAVFAFYGALLLFNIKRGRVSIDCGCSWVKSASLSPVYVYRNGALATISLLILIPSVERGLIALDYINAAGFAVIMAGAYLLFDAMLHLKSLETAG